MQVSTALRLSSGAGIDGPLYDFLQAVGLAHLSRAAGLASLTLESCVRTCGTDRTLFLSTLREAGVTKVAERQALANAVGKACRAGWLRPPYKGPFTEAGRALRDERDREERRRAANDPWGQYSTITRVS